MSIEDLEPRIDEVRTRIRRAMQDSDPALARDLRAQLEGAEAAWEAALSRLAPPPGIAHPPLVPFRERVHHALTVLTVPAAPRLIGAVHAALFGADLAASRFTSQRRDEERSFQSSPYARPYYLCPALTTDRLGPVRGLLAISTWPLVERLVGPLSPRVHFLTAATSVAEAVTRAEAPRPEARRLLIRFAANIPGATDAPAGVMAAAREELVIHAEADLAARESAVPRAEHLTDTQRLFGVRFGIAAAEEAG